jgi:dTDP-glucose 4,6-dehydratase
MSHCTNNYGPFQHEEKLIPLIIGRLLNSERLPIYGKGQNIRDWLYVEDHAEAIWHILNFGKSGETYDIGGNEEKTNLEVVNTLIEVLSSIKAKPLEEYSSLISFVKDRPGHDFRYAIDCSKIKKELRWQPRHSFQEGIKKTILWYMEKFDSKKMEKMVETF